ncbi:hypothetical protein IMZ48_43250 [Candidatus Bathyarchaeota archaeon]|nr:hypothetical protein [Candidatus Bathyarchaeota archaeon]
MSSRSTSFSAANPGHARRSSVASRLSHAVSTAERGEADHAAAGEQHIEEEIAKIRRYEVCDALPCSPRRTPR